MPDKASTVSVVRCACYDPDEVRSAVVRVLRPFGGIGEIVHPGEKILLKPNFVTRSRRGIPACTNPEVVLALARLVREAGAQPVIGDSPAFGTSRSVAKSIGLLRSAEEEGIPILTFRRSVVKEVELDNRRFRISVSREAIEFDGILNLAKFKAHRQTGFTFGTKNLYGCVVGKRKACRHFASSGDLDWFSNMLVANAKLLSARLTLVDGVTAMEGQGPVRGTPRSLHVLVAGKDVTAVDTVCCRIVGADPLSLCTIRAARRLGYGVWDSSRITVSGDSLETLSVTDFQFADRIPIFFSLPHLMKSYLRSWRETMAPE